MPPPPIAIPRPPTDGAPKPPGRWKRLSPASLRYRGVTKRQQREKELLVDWCPHRSLAECSIAPPRSSLSARRQNMPRRLRVQCEKLPELTGYYHQLPQQSRGETQWGFGDLGSEIAQESGLPVLRAVSHGRWRLGAPGGKQQLRSVAHNGPMPAPDKVTGWEMWTLGRWVDCEVAEVEVVISDADGEPLRFGGVSAGWKLLDPMSVAEFTFLGKTWRSVEHLYHAVKFHGKPREEDIRNAATPEEAGAMGRDRGHPPRADWDRVMASVMALANRAKFMQHEAAREELLSTGTRELCYCRDDAHWGVGPDGRNAFGQMLQTLRTLAADWGRWPVYEAPEDGPVDEVEQRVSDLRVRAQLMGDASDLFNVEGEDEGASFLCDFPSHAPLDTRLSTLITAESGFTNAVADACREMLSAEGVVIPAYLFPGNRLHAAVFRAVGEPCSLLRPRDSLPLMLSTEELRAELPLPVRMSVLSLRGAEIQAAMEHHVAEVSTSLPLQRQRVLFPHLSGLRLHYDSAREPGQRVVRVLIGGSAMPIQERISYRIAVPEPLSYGVRGVKPYIDRPRHDSPWSRTPLLDIFKAWYARRQGQPVPLTVGGRVLDVSARPPSAEYARDWRWRPQAHPQDTTSQPADGVPQAQDSQ